VKAAAANDPSKVPPLTPEQRARLQRAYDRTQLAKNDISFEDALASPYMAVALVNMAAAIERAEQQR
jgi:hypothetical protein